MALKETGNWSNWSSKIVLKLLEFLEKPWMITLDRLNLDKVLASTSLVIYRKRLGFWGSIIRRWKVSMEEGKRELNRWVWRVMMILGTSSRSRMMNLVIRVRMINYLMMMKISWILRSEFIMNTIYNYCDINYIC